MIAEYNLNETKTTDTTDIKLDLNNVPVPSDLKELVTHIRNVFSKDDVNVEYVIKLLENYKSNAKDWRQYAKYDPHKYLLKILLYCSITNN